MRTDTKPRPLSKLKKSLNVRPKKLQVIAKQPTFVPFVVNDRLLRHVDTEASGSQDVLRPVFKPVPRASRSRLPLASSRTPGPNGFLSTIKLKQIWRDMSRVVRDTVESEYYDLLHGGGQNNIDVKLIPDWITEESG